MKKRLKIIIISLTAIFALGLILFFSFENAQTQPAVLQSDSGVRDDVITSVSPSGVVAAYEKQKLKVTVTALTSSEVKVRVGAKKYKTKEKEKLSDGYSLFEATVKMPQSQMEIESIGIIAINAVYNGQAYSLNAFQVFYSPNQSVKTTTAQSTTLPAQNFVSEDETSVSATTARITESQSAYVSEYTPPVSSYVSSDVTSLQMCTVTGSAADTWPGDTSDDTFVPYSTPLISGTMDYITGESEAYDSEEGETRYFYNLACGKRVLKKSVQVVSQSPLGDNSISVLSSQSSSGTLKIVLSQNLKVPFGVSVSPQQYYSAYGKKYNVNSFTAQSVQFTFYHTVSAGGAIDTSGSDVVSSASWSVDSASKTATLTLPLRTQGVYYGYSAEYDINGNLVLTIHNKVQSLSGSVILLDPGHGGSDSGAVGYEGAIKESQLNFANAVALKTELESRGATVYLTRYDDIKVSLDERKNMAYSLKPDLFISLHCDGYENKEVYGTSSFYFKPMSQPLAQSIYNEMKSVYSSYIYSSQPDRAATAARGCKFHPFSVTRIEDCPSVLIEVGYITNNAECAMLIEEATRTKIAAAIANGIENYILSK